jgi:hypothetical protein
MSATPEATARDYLQELHARRGWSGGVPDEDVRRLAALLRAAVSQEREACAVVADELFHLYGSLAVEQAAQRIRGRDPAGENPPAVV